MSRSHLMVGELLGGDKESFPGRESKVNSCAKGTESMMFFFKGGGHFSKKA